MLLTNFICLILFFLTDISASETVTKANLESIRRSIEYRITQEAKITRHLFAAHNNVSDIDRIMQDEQINDIPKLNLEDFQYFDSLLKTDLELIKKLVKLLLKLYSFILLVNMLFYFLEMFYVDKH